MTNPGAEDTKVSEAVFQSVLYPPGHDDAKAASRGAPAYFHDLSLDQITESITAGKGEYDLKPFFHAPLPNIEAIMSATT